MTPAADSVDRSIETIEQVALTEDGYAPDDFSYNGEEEVVIPKIKPVTRKEIDKRYTLEEPPNRHKAYVDVRHVEVVEFVPKFLDHCLRKIKVGNRNESCPRKNAWKTFWNAERAKGIVVNHQPETEHYLLDDVDYPKQYSRLCLEKNGVSVEMRHHIFHNVMGYNQYSANDRKKKKDIVEVVA